MLGKYFKGKDDIDLSKSNLPMDGTEEDQEKWCRKVKNRSEYLDSDQSDRKSVYKIRRDFYIGNQSKYTNIVGLQNKEKKGHANSVINYAGKTVVKIAYSLANNPPAVTIPMKAGYKPDDDNYIKEEVRTQAVEDFVDTVLTRNKFWLRPYRRGVFNQSILGDYAIKVYPVNMGTDEAPEWDIKITAAEKLENLKVGWASDDTRDFDYVIYEQNKSVQSVEAEWGIKVPEEMIQKPDESTSNANSSHANNGEWGQRNVGLGGRAILPAGKNNIPTVKVTEYDDINGYAILIGGKLVQLALKDDSTIPKQKYWIIGENIPNPGSYWSIADIDYLIDINIEMNEASNEERDYIRVGANTKYVAYNMEDFDPESVKTGSGGVVFVNNPEGNSKFEALQTNVNVYPADSYLNRMKKHMHDLGVPEVTYGGAGADSGKSKAIDYQSLIDLSEFKRDSWELTFQELYEKIQIFGGFYFKEDFFNDAASDTFTIRNPAFDWTDILPVTQADKVVNILNKVQMGLPFKEAFKELGYRDVEAIIGEMKQEAKDPDMMVFRSKLWQLTKGIAMATAENGSVQPANGVDSTGAISNQSTQPTLTSSQNSGAENNLPVSQRGGTTAVSTPKGALETATQNQIAKTG